MRQGCGLGALLFAVSMKEISDNIQRNNPDVTMVTIMNDLYFPGKPAACLNAYKEFAAACAAKGSLEVNHSKGQYMSFNSPCIPLEVQEELLRLKLKLKLKVAKVLGAPVGSDVQAVTKFAYKVIQKYFSLFEPFQHEKMQVVTGVQILRTCGVPSISYLLRVVPPSIMQVVAEKFDRWVRKAYFTKHQLEQVELSDSNWRQLVLPRRCAGMGLTDHRAISWFAYCGAVAASSAFFCSQRFNASVDSLYAKHASETCSHISYWYPQLVAREDLKGIPLLPEVGDLFHIHSFYGIVRAVEGNGVSVVPHLHGVLTRFYNGVEELKLMKNQPPKDIARIHAGRARNASSWMDLTPESVEPLSDEACRISHRLRLGVEVVNQVHMFRCLYGEKLPTGEHVLGCMNVRDGKLKLRHNKVVDVLVDYIRKLGGIATPIDKAKYRKISTIS